MKPLRVLSILSVAPPLFSGATQSWMRLAHHFPGLGVTLEFLYRTAKGEIVLEREDGCRNTIEPMLGTRAGTYLGIVLTTVKAIVQHRRRYSCLFFLSAPDAIYLVLLAKALLGLRVIYRMTMLGGDDPLAIAKQSRLGWLRLRILRRIDAAVCINPAMAQASQQAGLPLSRIVTILQSASLKRFRPGTPAERAALRVRERYLAEEVVVLFCGVIVARKGVDLLLNAWPSVYERHRHSRLLLVGPTGGHEDPSEAFFASMLSLAESLDCRDSVRFAGPRHDVDELMRAADVLVLPSRMEGAPNVLVEAMATGLPTVISDLPGVAGVFVRDGVEGLVVAKDDAAQLARCLEMLIANPALRTTLGTRARHRALEQFSDVEAARRFATVFRGEAT
jgi:glycosyltransferase involved in cell wall biosynthesis